MDEQDKDSVILHVCTSCRPADTPREPASARPGAQLYARLEEALREHPLRERVELRPAPCLSLCPRPCAIALQGAQRWTYLFGDQAPDQTVEAILACAALYVEASRGELPRAQRPEALRASILGRVPPLDPTISST